MALNVTIAGVAIPTNLAALKSFPNNLNLAFSLDSTFSALLGDTLEDVPSSAATSTVTYTSPSASWNPEGGPVTFGLSGGVTGTLAIVTSGSLLSYTDGLDSPQTKTVPVPANTAYLSLTLNFNISANVAGKYSGGAYGVTAALSIADSYSITWSKAFLPTTLVSDALAEVFESFVLPFHVETLNQMNFNDYLLYEFDGNLHLSFGAYVGLDQVLYAGQSTADVLNAFDSPLATLSVSTEPTVEFGANLSFSYQYATLFQALLSKLDGAARLHLYRSDNATSSTNLTAGLTFDANITASINAQKAAAQASVVDAAGGTGVPAGTAEALKSVLEAGSTEIDKYVSEVNDKLSSWLNRSNGIKANLEVAIETSGARTILAAYDFDLNSAAYPAAWKFAINGDFVEAFQAGSLSLEVGSGLEESYQSRTTFSCNFFDLWSMSTWSQFSSKVTLVYAGNNVFHLVANVGRTTQTTVVGAMRSLDFYFAASSDVNTGGLVSNVDIELHINLTAQDDPKAAVSIATMLSAIEAGPTSDALARSMHAFVASSPQGTVQLQVTIPSSAYAKINCDPYSNGKPLTTSTYNDAQNYVAFAQAADDLQAWPLPILFPGAALPTQGFKAWSTLNLTMNDAINRLNTFYPIGTWPPSFPDLDSGSQSLVIYSLTACQTFMNFCADLQRLIASTDVTSAGTNWNSLVNLITSTIKNDVNVDFARPTALAVIRLFGSSAMTVTGPTWVAVPQSHFAVTLTL